MQLGHYDDMAYRRPATADRAHAVDQIELVRTVCWREPGGREGSAMAYVKVDIIGWVVQLICEPEGKDGAWNVLGVMSNFTILKPGQFLQPVERVVFMWERTDTERPGARPVVTTAVDYNNTVGEHYQPTAAHCFQVVETYMNRLDPEHDFDPSALVPDGQVPQGS